jgi:hypothetical protein
MDIVGLSFVVFMITMVLVFLVLLFCPLKYIVNVSKQGFFGNGIELINNK